MEEVEAQSGPCSPPAWHPAVSLKVPYGLASHVGRLLDQVGDGQVDWLGML